MTKTSKVILKPTSVIKAQRGIDPTGPVQWFFTNTCYKAMDKYVPMKYGNLRKNVTIETDTITYESPYSRYQYYGVREDGTHKVRNYTTAGTGPYWDQRMWSVEKDNVVEAVQHFIDRGV